MVVDGAGPDGPSCWWRRVAGAQEDRAGGWASDDGREPKHACISTVAVVRVVALGRLAVHNECRGWSALHATAPLHQPNSHPSCRSGLCGGAVLEPVDAMLDPWPLLCWRIQPTTSTDCASATEGPFVKTADEFSCAGSSPFPPFPSKARIFLTLFYPPSPLFVPIQVVDANPGVPAHSAYPQHQR